MRICDLTNLYIDGGEGGVNTYLSEKGRYIENLGNDFQHFAIIPAARNQVRHAGKSTYYAIASPRYFRNPQHRIIFNRRAVTEILRRERPDIVEVDCASLLGQVARRAFQDRRPPIVGFYHVHLPTFFARKWGERFGTLVGSFSEQIAWRFVKACLEHCDRIVVSSEDIYERLQKEGFGVLNHIPLGVNTELFRPSESANGGTPSTAGNRPSTVLYVGRLSREKELSVLFSAFDHLQSRGPFRMRIVGDGPLKASVQRFAHGRGNVEYLGLCPYGETLARIYRQADVVAMPSASETFGLTILEALASGVPVVAARRGGPSRLIHPQLGALAEPGDAVDLAAKIDRVANSGRRPQTYRNHVLKHFTWEQTFERLLELYRNLIRGRRRVVNDKTRQAANLVEVT